jgi:hypothetical protein
MPHVPIESAEGVHCPICQSPAKIELRAKFQCLKCGQDQANGVLGRVKGSIVWLAGKGSLDAASKRLKKIVRPS